MSLALSVLSALAAMASAVFWFRCAQVKSPEEQEVEATWDGIEPALKQLAGALRQQASLNRWAAGFAGLSVLLQAASITVSAASR